MQMYNYTGIHKLRKLASQFFGVIGIAGFTAFALLLWSGISAVELENTNANPLYDARFTFLCLGLWSLFFAWLVGASLLNLLPTVWIDEQGLQISAFIFLKIKIPWNYVLDIGQGHPPKGYVLVRTKGITLFHRFYGWLYSFSLYPSFLIGPGIENRERLISEIRRRAIKKFP